MTEKLLDRIYGGLIGCYIGTLFSRPMGHGTHREFKEKYGWLSDIPKAKIPVFEGTRYEWIENTSFGQDGATAITELYVNAYAKQKGRINIDDLHREWLAADFPFNNLHSLNNNMKELFMKGMPARLAGAYACMVAFSTTSSIPVGIFNAFDPAGAYLDTRQIASISQKEPALSTAAVLSACIAESLRPNATMDTVIDVAAGFIPDKDFTMWDNRKPNNPAQALKSLLEAAIKHKTPKDAFEDMSFIAVHKDPKEFKRAFYCDFILPLPVALSFLVLGKGDFHDSILGAFNFGAYAYLTTSLVGAIAGALNGSSAIPAKWLKTIDGPMVVRFRRMAEDMLEVLEEKMMAQEKQIQQVAMLQK